MAQADEANITRRNLLASAAVVAAGASLPALAANAAPGPIARLADAWRAEQRWYIDTAEITVEAESAHAERLVAIENAILAEPPATVPELIALLSVVREDFRAFNLEIADGAYADNGDRLVMHGLDSALRFLDAPSRHVQREGA